MASRRAVIEPGSTLIIGRTDRAGLMVPQDAQMSGHHLELSWDGATCLLRDLKSVAGTEVDGMRVDSAELTNGSWIRAGTTNFCFYIEEATPPPRGSADLSPEEQARHHEALEAVRAESKGAHLFALLDAVQSDRILVLLRESVEAYQSLFEGIRGAVLEEAAPYLVQLPDTSRLLSRLVQEGWGKSWGVYLVSRRPLAEVRSHFRKLLYVTEEETRREMYFRFYDPRVLRAFLPSCTARQSEEMFGEIKLFLTEGAKGEVLRFSPGAASAEGPRI